MAKLFAQVTGVVLLLLGILGFVTGDYVLGFNSATLEDVTHVVLGLVGLYVGFLKGDSMAVKAVRILGPVYLLVAIVGFISPSVGGLWNPDLRGADHILHLVLGLIGSYLGYAAAKGSDMARS